jgi:hypothetical protein
MSAVAVPPRGVCGLACCWLCAFEAESDSLIIRLVDHEMRGVDGGALGARCRSRRAELHCGGYIVGRESDRPAASVVSDSEVPIPLEALDTSSQIRIDGFEINARAMATRCRSPPES